MNQAQIAALKYVIARLEIANAGECEHAKALQSLLDSQSPDVQDELREAARQFHNLTQGDSTVIIRAPSAEKRDAIAAAGARLRAALTARGEQGPNFDTWAAQRFPAKHLSTNPDSREMDEAREFAREGWIACEANRGQAPSPLRVAVDSMVTMLENKEWAEGAAHFKAPGDELASRLEAAITDLHNDIPRPALENGFFVFHPDSGHTAFYTTDAEREAAHNDAINDYRIDARRDGEWSNDVDSIVSGIVTHRTAEVETSDDDHSCDYHAEKIA